MKELLLKVKTATLINGVAVVSKNGVGVMVRSNGKIYFCPEGGNEWEEVTQ